MGSVAPMLRATYAVAVPTTTTMKRVCIYPKDAGRILNISDRQARRLFQTIRTVYSKEKHQYISVKEFCTYTGLDEDDVNRLL